MYVNAPRYLLRKKCIFKMLKGVTPGKALEIGCGAGDLSKALYDKGFSVKGIDFSEEAISICRQRKENVTDPQRLCFEKKDFSDIKREHYDSVFMFEVLEHIENDIEAINQVSNVLNQNGYLFLSVPAHQNRFGASDRFAGHYRRYDRDHLIKILEENGFDVEIIWSYGVPLSNITELIRNRIYQNKTPESKEIGTKQSGINREVEYKFRYLCNDFFMLPFYFLQQFFFKTNWGNGWIVRARKC